MTYECTTLLRKILYLNEIIRRLPVPYTHIIVRSNDLKIVQTLSFYGTVLKATGSLYRTHISLTRVNDVRELNGLTPPQTTQIWVENFLNRNSVIVVASATLYLFL